MKIAYLMDPLETIQPENETTSHLMYECNERGHTVYFLEPHDVYIRSDQVVARMRNITVDSGLGMAEYWRAIIRCTKQDHLIFETITELDALFLRSNPPLNYQTMEFLQTVNNHVFILNSTTGQPGDQIQGLRISHVQGLVDQREHLAGIGITGQPDIDGTRFLGQSNFKGGRSLAVLAGHRNDGQ